MGMRVAMFEVGLVGGGCKWWWWWVILLELEVVEVDGGDSSVGGVGLLEVQSHKLLVFLLVVVFCLFLSFCVLTMAVVLSI